MAVDLAERATELQALDHALDAPIGGEGSVVLVSGEAGIGKSSVLRSFRRAAGDRALAAALTHQGLRAAA